MQEERKRKKKTEKERKRKKEERKNKERRKKEERKKKKEQTRKKMNENISVKIDYFWIHGNPTRFAFPHLDVHICAFYQQKTFTCM
jgi:hypothetical protein